MSKSVADCITDSRKKWATENNTFSDFKIGDKVKIITPAQDFYFFFGETGKVTKNTGKYLGITVEFDKPRHFEDGCIQKEFNFEPQDLFRLTVRKEQP